MDFIQHFDNFLDNDVFENIVAFFRFQHEFLESKSYNNAWYPLNDDFHSNVYRNDNLTKASSPTSCIHKLIQAVSDVDFLNSIEKNFGFTLKDITDIKIHGLIMTSGASIKTHADPCQTHRPVDEIVLKMIYYGHEIWDEKWYGEFEMWKDGLITKQYVPNPNKLVVFLSNNQTFHRVAPIAPVLPYKMYRYSIVINVRFKIKLEKRR